MHQEFIWITKGGAYYAKSIGVSIGKNCRIFTRRFGTEPFLIEIGNNVTITKDVIILTHDGSTWLFNDQQGRRYMYRKVKIGNNVFIGVNSIIMPGVCIGDNVIVGAGSIVTKSIPSGSIIAGNPAKIIGDFFDYKNKVLGTYLSDAIMTKEVSKIDAIKKITANMEMRVFLNDKSNPVKD